PVLWRWAMAGLLRDQRFVGRWGWSGPLMPARRRPASAGSVSGVLRGALRLVLGVLRLHPGGLRGVLSGVLDLLGGVLHAAGQVVLHLARDVLDPVGEVTAAVLEFLAGAPFGVTDRNHGG